MKGELMKKILVVETEAHQRMLYRWELSDEGYCVVTASSLEEAGEKIKKAPPDCIVLGVGRRWRNAPAKVQSFLRSVRDVPVVVNTTYNDCGGKRIRSLTDDCVVKSSNVEELRAHIRTILA